MDSQVAILRDLDRLDKGADRRFDRAMKTKSCLYNLVPNGQRPVRVTLRCGTKVIFKASNLK